MGRRHRFALWLAALFAGSLAVIVSVAAMIGAGQSAEDRAVLLRLIEERAPALFFLAALLLVLCGAIVTWFFKRYLTAARVLAEQTRVVLGANPGFRVAPGAAPELAELATEINRLAGERSDLLRDLEARTREAGAKLEEERNRLAALMSELSEGVLVCNAEGRILLYNERAKALFAGSGSGSGATPVGLGRSVFALIDREQIAHTMEKLRLALVPGEAPPSTRLVSTTADGRLLRVRAAPFVDSSRTVAGMVLALEDVTALLDQEATRRALLQSLVTGVRAPAANLRAAAENLSSFPEMDSARRGQFTEIVVAESRNLSQKLDEALWQYADALKAQLALEDMRAADLLGVVRQRIRTLLGLTSELGAVAEDIWLRVDSFAFVQVLAFLAMRLRDEYSVRSLRLSARMAGGHAELDMEWAGSIVASEALSLWENEPMQVGTEQTPLTLRDVLDRHGGEVWYQRSGPGGQRAGHFRFLLPAGGPAPLRARVPAASAESRPEYYDFDLFNQGGATQALQESRLADLAYTVFDTETTGLEPSAGDEIISIGAARIVNGRLLKSEVFEQLVNPRRALNSESAAIHGISAEALAGQPVIERVLPSFHRFCEDSVLVAHNAAFDMRFLQLKEASSGVRFTQPVLDTLLLSAAVHPNHADHRLESIAERLGVGIIGRHTALGDALLTGEIFVKLLPLLAERGIGTLGEALEASRQTYYARLQY